MSDIGTIVPIDESTTNYGDFFHFSFMLYVLSTMDSFPDM